MTDDLVAFLRARLAEDERTARDTAAEYGAVWTVDDGMESVRSDTGADVVEEPFTPRAHIARHDPARVLAEVDAKRRMLDEHELVPASAGEQPGCEVCVATPSWGPEVVSGPCTTLRLLALPYADHADYREEWRPDPA